VQVLYNNDTLVPFNTAISTMTSSHTIPMKRATSRPRLPSALVKQIPRSNLP
jgi:hypothetical protein